MAMKITDAVPLLITCIRARIPVILWGSPGIGKSDVVRQVTESIQYRLIDLRLPQLDPTDLRGCPIPDRATKLVEWYSPSFLPQEKDSKGVLFLDEIEKAPVMVKNASLQLCLDRRLGDYVLPDGWAIVAASNREDDECFSGKLGSALANRFMHIEVEADTDTWFPWARKNGIDEEIIGFLQFKSEYLFNYSQGATAFPSPRSWANVSKALATYRNQTEEKDESLKKLAPNPTVEGENHIIAGLVGKAIAGEFKAWVKIYKGIDVEAIVKHGKLPTMKESDISFKYAVALAVSNWTKKNVKIVKGLEENIATFLRALTPEMRVVFAKNLPMQVVAKLATHPDINKVIRDIMDYAF